MPIDSDVALGATLAPFTTSWDADAVILSHLGIGAGIQRPTDRADHMVDGDVTAIARYVVRFTGIVFPGETITSMWRVDDRFLLTATTEERGEPVLSNAAVWTR